MSVRSPGDGNQGVQLRRSPTSADPQLRQSLVPGGFEDDPPEKQGWLKKMGNNMAKDWKRRYVALSKGRIFYYRSYQVLFHSIPN